MYLKILLKNIEKKWKMLFKLSFLQLIGLYNQLKILNGRKLLKKLYYKNNLRSVPFNHKYQKEKIQQEERVKNYCHISKIVKIQLRAQVKLGVEN